MRYIQSNPIFYGFTISFHHSKEVFVCCLIVSLRCVFWVGPSIRGGGIDSPRPASQRAAALVLTAALLTGAAFPAFADTYYIEDGDITISAGKDGNDVTQNEKTTYGDKDTVITNQKTDKASSNTVTINAGNDKVEVTLDNVNIKADSGSALISKGDVTLTLKGDNHLTGGNGGSSSYGGDGITSSGSLTISGGTVTATGGDSTSSVGSGGSGIYSVSGGSGIDSSGGVTVSGGTVTANGGDSKDGDGGSGGYGISSSGVAISGGTVTANGGDGGSGSGSHGGNGIYSSSGVAISGGAVTANGGDSKDGSGGNGIYSSGGVTISSGSTVTANGGNGEDGSGGRGITSNGGVTVSGGTVNAKGGSGKNGNGGDGIRSFNPVAISGGTVNANGGNSDYSNGGDGIRSLDHVAISGGTVKSNGGSGNLSGGNGIISYDIDLSGSLELTAKAGSPNGKALSQAGHELDLDAIKDKLDPGAKVTVTDADGNVIQQVSIPRPVEPEKPVIPEESSSSSDGGSATPSAPASPLPGLTVTDKDGQRISYTSTQGGNTLTVCVGRFTASLRASLSALRQLRAEGIETITFQTILCSTTLSVDELLAMGGEDAEVVLTHHIRSSTLTVGGKAV